MRWVGQADWNFEERETPVYQTLDEETLAAGSDHCIVYTPPDLPPHKNADLFLAGSCLKEDLWRDRLLSRLAGTPLIIYNPERSDFPPEDIHDPSYLQQVAWERTALLHSRCIAMWLDHRKPTSYASRIELGVALGHGIPVILGMSPDFPGSTYLHAYIQGPIYPTYAEFEDAVLRAVVPPTQLAAGSPAKKNLALLKGAFMLTDTQRTSQALLALQKEVPTTDPHELALDGLLVHALAIQYADPKDKAYPIDAGHIRAAITYFGKNAHRYPKDLQKSIAKRILRAAVRHGIEVGENDRIKTIAAGKGPATKGTHDPGRSEVAGPKKEGAEFAMPGVTAMEATKDATEAKTTNGPAGPHPFPAETQAEHDNAEHEVGTKELFDMIEHINTWTESQQDDRELALFTELLGVLDQPAKAL